MKIGNRVAETLYVPKGKPKIDYFCRSTDQKFIRHGDGLLQTKVRWVLETWRTQSALMTLFIIIENLIIIVPWALNIGFTQSTLTTEPIIIFFSILWLFQGSFFFFYQNSWQYILKHINARYNFGAEGPKVIPRIYMLKIALSQTFLSLKLYGGFIMISKLNLII